MLSDTLGPKDAAKIELKKNQGKVLSIGFLIIYLGTLLIMFLLSSQTFNETAAPVQELLILTLCPSCILTIFFWAIWSAIVLQRVKTGIKNGTYTAQSLPVAKDEATKTYENMLFMRRVVFLGVAFGIIIIVALVLRSVQVASNKEWRLQHVCDSISVQVNGNKYTIRDAGLEQGYRIGGILIINNQNITFNMIGTFEFPSTIRKVVLSNASVLEDALWGVGIKCDKTLFTLN